MKDVMIVGYVEIDGIRTFSDEVMRVVWEQIQKDGGDEKRAWRSIPLNLDPSVKGQGCLLSLKVNGVELIEKGESNAIAA